MTRITFTAESMHEDIIEEVENEEDVESRAEAVRECITRYADLQQRVEELQQEVSEQETELERLRNEKRLILEERNEKEELANYVEEERRVEQRWREASLTKRMKWKVFGMPSSDQEAAKQG
jgi:DNA repair exonuclease SbcCD ATPase subunit